MKKPFLSLILLLCLFYSFAQTSTDSTTYFIHKFEQNIGKETALLTQKGDTLDYGINFNYVDRGSPVQLKAHIQLTSKLDPLLFIAKGGTSRFSHLSDSVVIHGKTATEKVDDSTFTKLVSGAYFPVAGYSPATAQMLLVQYWQQHKQPAGISLLP